MSKLVILDDVSADGLSLGLGSERREPILDVARPGTALSHVVGMLKPQKMLLQPETMLIPR